MNLKKKTASAFGSLVAMLALLNFSMLSPASLWGQDEPLLPLPPPGSEGLKPSKNDPNIIIPLPTDGKHKPVTTKKPVKDGSVLPLPQPPENTESPQIIVNPKPDPAVIEINPSELPPPQPPVQPPAQPLVPPQPPAQTGVAAAPPSGQKQAPLPAFPKDTSSAVFMLMKSWECSAYDGHTLLEHAVGVYGTEAEDKFELKGMDRIPKFNVTMKEDDITLDELLDILANKNGFDWGVDIPGKVVYVYPGNK